MGRRILWAWLVLGALLLPAALLPGRVLAHAHLVRADLAPDSQQLPMAGTVRFWFDEAVDPALSSIAIRDAGGSQIPTSSARPDPTDPQALELAIPELAAGRYSVYWSSDSAQDAHVMHGSYLFTVGARGAAGTGVAGSQMVRVAAPTLDTSGVLAALAHWLVLGSGTLWTGAVALALLVLGPARASGSARTLAAVALGRALRLAQVGLLASLGSLAVGLAVQIGVATGLGGLTSARTFSSILRTRYCCCWSAQVVCTIIGLLLVALLTVTRPIVVDGCGMRRLAGWSPAPIAAARADAVARWSLGLLAPLGLVYLLAQALSGHAATVPVLAFTSVGLDWLHLLATSVWIGGMVATAFALLPATRGLLAAGADGLRTLLALLSTLDRFSPAAYLALATAACTGMFNAQVRLGGVVDLFGTAYGRLLLIKLAVIGAIVALSGSHVLFTRPRLRRLCIGSSAIAGLATLARRLRVEVALGGVVLLCVSLMGQVAPTSTVHARAVAAGTQGAWSTGIGTGSITQGGAPGGSEMGAMGPMGAARPTPEESSGEGTRSISATRQAGSLAVTLVVSPPIAGRVRFAVTVRDDGRSVTTGQVRIKLSIPASPALGSVFVETLAQGDGYVGAGDLVQDGGLAGGCAGADARRSAGLQGRAVRLRSGAGGALPCPASHGLIAA